MGASGLWGVVAFILVEADEDKDRGVYAGLIGVKRLDGRTEVELMIVLWKLSEEMAILLAGARVIMMSLRKL